MRLRVRPVRSEPCSTRSRIKPFGDCSLIQLAVSSQIEQHAELMTPHLVNGSFLTCSQDEFNVPRVQESHHGLSFCPPDNANLIHTAHIAGEGKRKAEHNPQLATRYSI